MESIEQESGRRRRRSYDEAFKRDAVRLVSEEKLHVQGGRGGGARVRAELAGLARDTSA